MHRARKSSAGYQAANQVRRAAHRTGRLAIAAGSFAVLLTAGCGASYRPVVSAISPVGPAIQPTKFAVAISNPGDNLPGLVTVVDFSGDTIIATPSIQSKPSYFALGNSGSSAYVINANGALDTFGVSNPISLITSQVVQTTLTANTNPLNITPLAGTGAGTTIFIPQAASANTAALGSNGPSLLTNLTGPTGTTPTYVVGTDSAPRAYILNSNGANAGSVSTIETNLQNPTITTTLPVGVNPVYGVMSADATRAFILNKGDGTVSVINVPSNALDLNNPPVTTPPTPATPLTITVGTNPVWAVLAPTLAELLVLNAGDGVNPGSLSIISIPLCNAVTPVTNPNCNPANPTDAVGFGTVVANIPVGVNPVMVDVLRDGSRAYVVNGGVLPGGSAPAVEGSVSVVNLQTYAVTTIPATSVPTATDSADASPTLVYGHPNSVSVSLASPTGKVYVTSSDNKFMTVLRTDTDAVTTHVLLQGLGVRVLVTAP